MDRLTFRGFLGGRRVQPSIDELQFYLAKGANLHPHTYTMFLELLERLEKTDKVCAVPLTIFQRFHFKFKKAV